MTTRREQFEIAINATPEQIWEMLTTADGLATWFGTEAAIDFEIGGTRTIGWTGSISFSGEISEIDPLKKLVVTYTSEGETGAEEWILTAEGQVTHLKLIHSMPDDGVEDWEGFYGDMRRGWTLFLASMKHALEKATVPKRTVEVAFPPTSDRPATWARIRQIIEDSDDLVGDMEVAVELEPHSIMLTAPDRTLIVDQEGSGSGHVIFVQASTFGGSDAWRQEAVRRLSEAGTD